MQDSQTELAWVACQIETAWPNAYEWS